MSQTTDLTNLVDRLCDKYRVTDMAALFETPEFRAEYARQQTAAPNTSAQSLVGKAIRAMRHIQTPNVTLFAHCIEPRYEKVTYDREAAQGAEKWVIDSLGVYIVTPDGQPKFVKFADYDPLGTKDQTPAAGWVPGLARGGAVTLKGVDTFEDLEDGTVKVTIKKTSTIELGGHNNSFPDGPDLEDSIGAAALKEGRGAWMVDKKFGTIKGKFGDIKGDPRTWVATVTDNDKDISVNTFDNDPVSRWHVAAEVTDRRGNTGGIKFFAPHIEQLGLSFSMPREAIIARIKGQRILCRGQGSIYMPKSPEDFGEDGAFFTKAVAQLQADGYMVTYGTKSRIRLSLHGKFNVDANTGDRVQKTSVRIGDKDVYDILQKNDTDWEISVLAIDEQKSPWLSIGTSTFVYKNRDTGEDVDGQYNRNAFCLFLETVGGELADDDPYLNLAKQMPLPKFLSAPANGAIPAPPTVVRAVPTNR